MDKEILIAPCNFRLTKSDFENSATKPLPHPTDGDKEFEVFNKDDVMVIVGKKDYQIDSTTLVDPGLHDEVSEELKQNYEDLDLDNPKHIEMLRRIAVEKPKNQFILRRAMSYYYSRSIKPKIVMPFSVLKVKLSRALVGLGYIPGIILLNTTTGKKGWISFVDFDLLKKDIESAKLGA